MTSLGELPHLYTTGGKEFVECICVGACNVDYLTAYIDAVVFVHLLYLVERYNI